MLARSNQFEGKTLIPLVADYVADHPVLFRRFRSTKDDAVNALCQFDFLQCLVTVDDTKELRQCYPNFGAYHTERTEPVVALLVNDGPVRQVAPDMGDQELADFIRSIDKLAGELFFDFAGWDVNWWTNQAISDFLKRYPQR
jgi:hypothetical protein